MSRWFRLRRANLPKNTQTFETEPNRTSVIGPAPIAEEVREQLKHAQEQLALTRQYPGRRRDDQK
jgi:hypothetical protein